MKRRYFKRTGVLAVALICSLSCHPAWAGSDGELDKSLKLLQQQLTDLQVQIRAIQDHLGVEPVEHAAPAEGPIADKVALPPGDAAQPWQNRGNQESLVQALTALEKQLEADPNNGELLEWLSRGYYVLTDGHMRKAEAERDVMLASYTKGFEYAMRGMRAVSVKFAECLDLQDPVEDCVNYLTEGTKGHIYWYAVNVGKFAALDSFPTLLFYKAQIFALMQRLLMLDELFYHGAAHRYFGAFYAKAPAWAGGNMDKAQHHFDKALEIAPNYFSTSVLMAEMYTPKREDPELFRKLLEFVINTDSNVLPGLEPEQSFEQWKATNLLEEIDDIF